MLKRKFSNKSDKEKPENATPGREDTNYIVTGNEEMPEVDEEVIEFSDNTEFESDETGDTVSEESNEEIEALQAEITELQDKYLRLVAEFDNYRKRTIREKAELIQTAGESLLKDILPLVDDFERGLDAAAQAEDMDAVRSGMDIIYNKLIEFLSNHGVKEIEAMNELFNTDWHDAVTNIPAPSDDMKGKIVDVIQKGYTLNDKIIRYPKVVVGE